MNIWSQAFWIATAERAVKTFAQSLAALLTADGAGLLSANWYDHLSVAGMAALLSVLTSILSNGKGTPGPSLTTEKIKLFED